MPGRALEEALVLEASLALTAWRLPRWRRPPSGPADGRLGSDQRTCRAASAASAARSSSRASRAAAIVSAWASSMRT